ncbi:MAG: hypothetical protein LBR56_04920 [Sporomusaceae bacterium]|jgi:hypothetical protein|nr:hypothetical protein [Sporomusaceae bacterium]
MKAPKIRKNLSDKDMFKGVSEENTFETDIFAAPEPTIKLPPKKEAAANFKTAFFTPELQEAVSKALLELKVQLYQEGIIDYSLKVSQAGHQVLLSAVPKAAEKAKEKQP